MSKKIERSLKLIEVMNICAWYNNVFTKEDENGKSKLKSLTLRMQWNLQQNIKQLSADAEAFEKFRNDTIGDVQKDYAGDDKSEMVDVTDVDAKGNPITDKDGNMQTHQERRIKSEFIDEYNEKINPINDELIKMLSEEKSYSLTAIDLDAIIDEDNGMIELSDLDILSAFEQEED